MPKFTFCFLLALSYLSSLAQNTLEQEITTLMNKYHAVGMSVVVVKNKEKVFQESFGQKNLERGSALGSDDIFRIASISKSFSATAIMKLVEQKKISLSDDVSDLIGFKIRNPQFPDSKITLKMLLSHTSSLNDSQGYFELSIINPEKNKDIASCFNNYAPGTDYQYCNLNFNIIGTVIEKVSGERFDQYITRHILNPLDLKGGYCIDSLDKTKFVSLYNFDTEKQKFLESTEAYNPRREIISNYVMGQSTPVFSPTGGMKISAKDLATYMMVHMNYGNLRGTKIISKRSSKKMQTPVNQKANYGLALLKTTSLVPGKTLVGHTGSAYGLFSSMFFDPKEKYGIVAITNGCENCSGESYNKLLQEVTNLLYNKLIIKK